MSHSREKVIMERFKSFQKKKDKYLVSFLVIFLAGYVFFFTSKLWMPPDEAKIPATEPGNSISLNERKVTLVSWGYDEDERLMEVQIEITNTAIDGINSYKWTAVELNEGILSTETIVEESSFVVVHIKNIPRKWEEISLRMGIKPEDEIKVDNFSNIKLYVDKNSVKAKKIKRLSVTEYRKEGCLSKIENYTTRIDILTDLIASEQATIEEGINSIQALYEQKKYQTNKEATDTDRAISEIQTKIDSSKSTVAQYEAECKELNDKISMQREIYERLSEN